MFNDNKNILISNFKLKDNTPQYSVQNWTGETCIRSTGVQYFQIEFDISLNQRDRLDLQQFIIQHKNGKPFDMSIGWFSKYSGSQKTSVLATVAAAVSATNITCGTNSIEIGSYIQFKNHKKIYQVLANNGTQLTIFPSLIKPVQIGEEIIFNNIIGSWLLNVPSDGLQIPSTNLIQMSFQATENIRG
ncbi:hypothetical protein DCF38_10920 [Edwardsiella piscicida]|uniref:hypothetical protein n=1 Tax=Edwardsiella piscicida TaxID=1263550 RepID=UPI00105745A3|nr:hypothetical protein [Edwardsiella piscicida]UCQ40048.1 hypothetical protein DCF38_10920 [Edwardsiella piscicida]